MQDQYARSEIERELEDGETIQWLGQPSPKSYALMGAPFGIFGIFWTASATFFVVTSLHSNPPAPLPFLLMPGLFILIGLGLIGQPLVYYNKAKRVFYAITNRRVLVVTAGKTRLVNSITDVNPDDITMTEQQDGSGMLMITKPRRDPNSNSSYAGVGFLGIPNVREAQAVLHQTFGKGNPGISQVRFK